MLKEVCFTIILCLTRLSFAGRCSQSYSCTSGYYKSHKYFVKCGFWQWGRCVQYSRKYMTHRKTCYRDVCCSGYTGYNCNTPICRFSCHNGGTCIYPDVCSCPKGYERPHCYDVNECLKNNGGCEHICKNTDGSYKCDCHRGYTLKNFHSCPDIDECADGTSSCEQLCINRNGSFTCGCKSGFILGSDGEHCYPEDQCTKIDRGCEHYCQNTNGSYRCECYTGFRLQSDGKSCHETDKCDDDNGGCMQMCSSQLGVVKCGCKSGWELDDDEKGCSDIDECEREMDLCEQTCNNTIGSYTCGCKPGFAPANDTTHCNNVDDCVNNKCGNNGTCVDGIQSYTCQCQGGFTGEFCNDDINECDVLNGGCREKCTNTIGSFICSCYNGQTVNSEGFCPGTSRSDVFQKHGLLRKYLPKGCYAISSLTCPAGNTEIILSSTSNWYGKANSNTKFTSGIVFMEVNNLSLPFSIAGAVVNKTMLSPKTGDYENDSKMNISGVATRQQNCISTEFDQNDHLDFKYAGSILKTLFKGVFDVIPDWMGLSYLNVSNNGMKDLQAQLILGENISDIDDCSGIPTFSDRLYAVFLFKSNFILTVYNEQIKFPKIISSKQYCFVVDICNGGTVFLMVPEESRNMLLSLKVFKTFQDKHHFNLRPRGIGLSKAKGVQVKGAHRNFDLWNGERMFRYSFPNDINMWIAGEMMYNPSIFELKGNVEIYSSVLNVNRMLVALYFDEWNALIKSSGTAKIKFQLELFEKNHTVELEFGRAELNAVMSFGGQQPRTLCNDKSNPSGIFLASKANFNPFGGIPFLKDYLKFQISFTTYIYLTFDADSNKPSVIDISKDVRAIQNVTNNMNQFLIKTLQQHGKNISKLLFDNIDKFLKKMQRVQPVVSNLLNIRSHDIPKEIMSLWNLVNTLEEIWEQLELEFSNSDNDILQSLKAVLPTELQKFKYHIESASNRYSDHFSGFPRDVSGIGLKFRCHYLNIFDVIKIPDIEFEMEYSNKGLLRCSRFDGVKHLMKGEHAVRFWGTSKLNLTLTSFLKFDGEVSLDMALALGPHPYVVIHFEATTSIFNITAMTDIYINRDVLQFVMEGNLWGKFFASLNVKSHLGKDWPALHVQGKLSTRSQRNSIRTGNESDFEDSYLDALRGCLKNIADGAQKRLSQAQNVLKGCKTQLTQAQSWLEGKKEVVRGANSAFDDAVRDMEGAKTALEKAKGPFQRAIEKLNAAQRQIDNLCKIRTCRKFCIPGIKCAWCHTNLGNIKSSFPCCHFTTCMFSIPDPICLIANIACGIVRGIAYAALEVAKLFVRIPMIALDVAKGAVGFAQFIVDKSRVVLKIAEVALDVAKFAIGVAKKALDFAISALEVIKDIIGIAFHVLDFVIKEGLQRALDVRNCQFNVHLFVADLAVFDISCEVNVLQTGWRKIGITINLKQIALSLWDAARTTINLILKSIGSVFSGRRKREVAFESASKMHILLRKARDSDDPLNVTSYDPKYSDTIQNESINLFKNVSNVYDDRTMIYKANCKIVLRYISFLKDTLENLHDISVKSKLSLDMADNFVNDLHKTRSIKNHMNLTTENLGINVDYARHYNLSENDVRKALEDAEPKIESDPTFTEIDNVTEFSKDLINSEKQSLNTDQMAKSWISALDNITQLHFNASECVGFADCVLLSMSTLYDVFSVDDHDNITDIRDILVELENELLNIVQNSSYNIYGIHNVTTKIKDYIHRLTDLNIYCSTPPVLLSELMNVTTVYGGNATFYCRVTSDPSPEYMWYEDDNLIMGESDSKLTITDITDTAHAYRCVGINVVTSVSSNDAFIKIITNETEMHPCAVDNGGCEQVCVHANNSTLCSCQTGFQIGIDLQTCEDIDECADDSDICTQTCSNTIGSFECYCNEGFHYDKILNDCIKDLDVCEKRGLNCTGATGCDVNNAVCYCREGYQLTDNEIECEDIDECAKGVCNQGCLNTDGGYQCTCTTGFVLDDDGTCRECDYPYWGEECNRTCDCAAATTCDPVIGCICEEGWRGDQCDEDIDECEENPDICNDTMQECMNDDGSYSCVCKEGFTKNATGSCEKIVPPYAIFSSRNAIYRIDLLEYNYTTLETGFSKIGALDFHYRRRSIYWSDIHNDKIYLYSGQMNSNRLLGVKSLIDVGLASLEAMAVDWITNKIYWLDNYLDDIKIADLNNISLCKTLVTGNIQTPNAIVLDPRKGMMFWSDWDLSNPRIESSSMSGDGRRVVFNILDTAGAGWPNGLTIDYDQYKLYWTDAKSHSIHSIEYTGANHRIIRRDSKMIQLPYSIAIDDNFVYWTELRQNKLLKANKIDGSDVEVIHQSATNIFDIRLYHPNSQPYVLNLCERDNGGCSHLCLLSFNQTRECKCPDEWQLQYDGKRCQRASLTNT